MNTINRRIFTVIVAAVNLFFVISIALWFFGKGDNSLAGKENSRLIGVSYMTMNNEFYKILNSEIEDRILSEGDRIMLRDPALSAERQNEQIEEMLAEGINALIVAPVDWEKAVPILRKAKRQGVIVIIVDTDVSDLEIADCTITSDNYSAGVKAAEYMLGDGKQHNVVLMVHSTAKSGLERIQGFKDTVAGHDNVRIVSELECEGQLEIAEPAMKEFIKSGETFDSVFCLNDLASVGVAAALEENGLTGKIELLGVDASPDAKAMIKERIMTASSAQFPTLIGVQTAESLYAMLNGESCEKRIFVPVELITA